MDAQVYGHTPKFKKRNYCFPSHSFNLWPLSVIVWSIFLSTDQVVFSSLNLSEWIMHWMESCRKICVLGGPKNRRESPNTRTQEQRDSTCNSRKTGRQGISKRLLSPQKLWTFLHVPVRPLFMGRWRDFLHSENTVTTPPEIIPYYRLNHSIWSLSDNKESSRWVLPG
jgi:hypothetical protein